MIPDRLPSAWDDLGMNWNNPDPNDVRYWMAIACAIRERALPVSYVDHTYGAKKADVAQLTTEFLSFCKTPMRSRSFIANAMGSTNYGMYGWEGFMRQVSVIDCVKFMWECFYCNEDYISSHFNAPADMRSFYSYSFYFFRLDYLARVRIEDIGLEFADMTSVHDVSRLKTTMMQIRDVLDRLKICAPWFDVSGELPFFQGDNNIDSPKAIFNWAGKNMSIPIRSGYDIFNWDARDVVRSGFCSSILNFTAEDRYVTYNPADYFDETLEKRETLYSSGENGLSTNTFLDLSGVFSFK